MKVLIEISARHLHLSATDAELLFGVGYQFQSRRPLSQIGQSAAEEKVTVKGETEVSLACRVILPHRGASQLELSWSEARQLGIKPPVSLSGNLQSAASVTLTGPAGTIVRPCAIISQRHLHINQQQLTDLGLKDGQQVAVAIDSLRPLRLEGVVVRLADCLEPTCHIDTDEANAAGLELASYGQLII